MSFIFECLHNAPNAFPIHLGGISEEDSLKTISMMNSVMRFRQWDTISTVRITPGSQYADKTPLEYRAGKALS
jgi:hypothetical protein